MENTKTILTGKWDEVEEVGMIHPLIQAYMIESAKHAAPEEAVGFLVRRYFCDFEGIVKIKNTDYDPKNHFSVDPVEVDIIEKEYPRRFLALWHSHPKTRSIPSQYDIRVMDVTNIPMAIVGLHPFPMIVLYGFEGRRIVELAKFQEAA